MAAGLGFKDFVTGEVLTAADVDGYLMQGIWVFASAAARDAAVTSPQEGNACYLKDTNEVLTYSGSAWVAVGGAGASYAVFRDEKTSGTDGGTFTSGAFRTRDLNATQYNGITSASLASNQISLPAGTYLIEAEAPANRVDQHQLRVQNITDSTTSILGQNIWCYSTNLVSNMARVSGVFTIAGTKTFELQHRCATTRAGDGFGLGAAFGTEVYASITISKVA
jgi:hypothetical protein